MKRRTEPDTERDEAPMPPHGTPPRVDDVEKPCPGCRKPVKGTELATYGNRCEACYRAFCSASTGQRSLDMANKALDGPLGWAEVIVERHRSGGNVTPAQLQMARDALRVRGLSTQEEKP